MSLKEVWPLKLLPNGRIPVRSIPCLALLLALGCDSNSVEPQRLSQNSARELQPVDLNDLTFAHDALRQRVLRIDRIANGMNFPKATTIGWSRRPPNKNDGRTLHDFAAQWSTVADRLGDAIQPGEEPASTVKIYAEVNPDQPDDVWRFSMSASSKTTDPGWDARITLFSYRPYLAGALGEEKLRFHFQQTDGKMMLGLPFRNWTASWPELPFPSKGASQTVIESTGPIPTFEEMRRLADSPESFREEALRQLTDAESRVLNDIAASRNVKRGSWMQIDYDDTVGFQGSALKDGETLTEEESQAFRLQATAEFQAKRNAIERDFAEMHAAIIRAFRIDQYLKEEPDGPTD